MQTRSAFVRASLALVSIFALGACTGVIGGADGGEGPAEGDGGSAGVGNGPATSGAGGMGGAGVGGAGMGGSGSGAGGAGQGAGGGGASSTAGSGGGAGCGDKVCSGGESCETCASDCGACLACSGAGAATSSLDAEEQGFLGIVNDYRAQKGLPPFAACTSLSRAAQGHSENMRDQNYFSHTGQNGSTFSERACDACYDHACPVQTAMAENIAAGNSTADAVFTQWKNSPGHNANMLGSSYKVIGIGRATGGGDYGVYWTTVFGGDTEASCN